MARSGNDVPVDGNRGQDGGSSTRAVERALALLGAVCTGTQATTLAEVARRTSVPASTALRLLRTLEREQFVSRDATASWRPGPRLLQLAVRSLARESLARLAQPALARLSRETGESCYLTVRASDGLAVHVAAAEGTHPIRHAAWLGHTIAVDTSPIGQALSGRLGADGYLAGSPAGEPDVTQVAAPVRRPGGIVAALSVVGPAYRLAGDRAQHAGELLVAEAETLHRALGWLPEEELPGAGPGAPTAALSRARDDESKAVAG